MFRSRSGSILAILVLVASFAGAPVARAATPSSDTLHAPPDGGTRSVSVTWTGGPYTMATPTRDLCATSDVNCDRFKLVVDVPAGYWDWNAATGAHVGSVEVRIDWDSTSDDFDLFVYRWSDTNVRNRGAFVDSSTSGGTKSERIVFPALPGGAYLVETNAWLTTNATFRGTATLTSTFVPPAMVAAFPDSRDSLMNELTVEYPLNVVFVGYQPTPAEIAELRRWIPDEYKPTVAGKSPGGDEVQNAGAGLLNWNKDHLIDSIPYFVGIKYRYKLRVFQASDDYAKALFAKAKDATAPAQDFKTSSRGQDLARYDALYGQYRVLAKGGDVTYKVAEPTKTDLVDAYAVEDWMFGTRYDARFACAFRDVETNACASPSIVQPDPSAYHDPFYDRNGLDLDRMPQGLNAGSSFFFFDTFMPGYAKDFFRPSAYHTWGTDRVENGKVVEFRITDPDTGDWDGVDFARTWGGRYRFHFVDLGAAPNNYESASWLKSERQLSSDYPHGDPPIWQYVADPQWKQGGDSCAADAQVLDYTGGTPCRIMPRLGRDVAYGLFFRSTAGYLYRPIPRGDVYWLAVTNWTDFYSRPQWVNGQITSAPWYGVWWTNTRKLYQPADVLRWLSAALPYARWVGRPGEVIPLYDPTNNQPTGKTLDTSPKFADLPAPEFHVSADSAGMDLLPEPLYGGQHVVVRYGDSDVDLTDISNAIEKAKARGLAGTYDFSVSDTYMRDHIDAHRPGIADVVPGVHTIPAINVVFEKVYTWALPLIVGGVATGTADGEAWGVFQNVNDRFKWDKSHYPECTPQSRPGDPCSTTSVGLPTQATGTGFSYTIEHEAAHNLGLSHPHDGSYGVDRCPADDPHGRGGTWQCYWSGLGWMYDIAAAPTTYAMSYRPYEVEDQDNLQRGHIAEYLLAAQESMRARLLTEAGTGATAPSATWTADHQRMLGWEAMAADLFRKGDYLHGEYAARNAALAARGIPQTSANTTAPRLLEAGQVFYFTVDPQTTAQPKPDLVITDLVASQDRPRQTILTATVENRGQGGASGVVVRFADGSAVLGDSDPVATLAAGAAAKVAFAWDTRKVKGEHTILATVDPANAIAETDETNNTASRTITIRGNRVTNGSFETAAAGQPEGWSGSGSTGYDTSGAGVSDGSAAVTITGGLGSSWTSSPITVVPGATYDLAMSVTTSGASSAPSLQVVYLDALGKVLSTATGVTTTIGATAATQEIVGRISVPQGVTSLQVRLIGSAPTDLTPSGTVWFDDIWLW